MKLFDVFGDDGSGWNKGGGMSDDAKKVCLTVGMAMVDNREYMNLYSKCADTIREEFPEIYTAWLDENFEDEDNPGIVPYFNDHPHIAWEDISRAIKIADI